MKNYNSQPIPVPNSILIDTINKNYLNKAGYLLYQRIINNFTYTI